MGYIIRVSNVDSENTKGNSKMGTKHVIFLNWNPKGAYLGNRQFSGKKCRCQKNMFF